MRKVLLEAKYKRDYRRISKGQNGDKLETVLPGLLVLLQADAELPAQYHDHPLRGAWNGCRECHVASDLLLIYRKLDCGELHLLKLERLGSHSDLF